MSDKYINPSGLTHYDEKIKEVINSKVNKIEGKGLSTNDLTDELLSIINSDHTYAGITTTSETNLNNITEPGIYRIDTTSKTYTNAPGINRFLLEVSTHTRYIVHKAFGIYGSTSGSATSAPSPTILVRSKDTILGTWSSWQLPNAQNSTTVNGHTVNSDVPSDAKFTDTVYGVATSSALGLVKSGTDITVDSSGNVSVNDDSHNHIISNIDGLQSALDGKAASSHTHSSYVNQNAFSNITVGSTTVSADSATDTLTLVAGSNVTITPDATNDKITIAATDTKYTHPTYTAKDSGLYKVTVDGTGHISATTAVTKSDITALGIPGSDTNTHYASGTIVNNSATATANTSSALTNGNVYLNHIENGSVKNSHKISGSGATTVTSDANGNIVISSTDNNTTYSNATTSTAGLMSASDKSKLDGITSSADSVSFSRSLTSGTKVGTITINGTGTDLYAPTNTDTHYTTGLKVGASSTATANAAATNGNVYMNVLDNTTVRDSHKIIGSGATTVTSDANGVITISSTDTNTVYTHPTSGVTAGTYRSVTVNAQGHVTAGTNPTVTVAQGGTGATTAANARTNLGVPPTSHASSANTYGQGTSSNFGHLKISNSYTTTPNSTTYGESAGIAASLYTVQQLYNSYSSLANRVKALDGGINSLVGTLFFGIGTSTAIVGTAIYKTNVAGTLPFTVSTNSNAAYFTVSSNVTYYYKFVRATNNYTMSLASSTAAPSSNTSPTTTMLANACFVNSGSALDSVDYGTISFVTGKYYFGFNSSNTTHNRGGTLYLYKI